MYATRKLSVQSQTLLTVALKFTLSVSVLHTLGAFRELALSWPEPSRTIYSVLQTFSFRIKLLNPGCVFGTTRS